MEQLIFPIIIIVVSGIVGVGVVGVGTFLGLVVYDTFASRR